MSTVVVKSEPTSWSGVTLLSVCKWTCFAEKY